MNLCCCKETQISTSNLMLHDFFTWRSIVNDLIIYNVSGKCIRLTRQFADSAYVDAALIGWPCRRDSCTSASGFRSFRASSWCPTRSSSLCANRLNQQLSKTKRLALQAACKLHNNYVHPPPILTRSSQLLPSLPKQLLSKWLPWQNSLYTF